MESNQRETPPGAEERRAAANRRFINRGTGFMILDNASKAAEPLLVLLCAKAYAGGDWGVFKYYESLALLLTRLAALGLDRGVVWMYSRCADDGEFVRRFSRAANAVLLLALGLAGLVLLQRLGAMPDLFDWRDKLPSAGPLQLILFLAAVPVQALTLLFLQAFLNKRVLMEGLLIRNLAVPVAIFGPALALSYTPWKGIGLALPYLLGNLAGLALAAAFFFRIYRVRAAAWSPLPGVSRDLLRFSLPIASTDVFMSFAYRVDLLLLGRYSGIQAVEVYAVITMISNTLRSFRQSFDGIILSVFSSEGAGRVTPDQRRHFNYATWLVTTVQLPFLSAAVIFGREILGLVAPVYASGYRVLIIAMAFNLLITPGAFSGQLLVGLGRTLLIPVAQGCFFVASVGLNLLLVPRYAAEGAAAATGLAHLLGGMVSFAGIWAYSRSFILDGSFLRPVALGALLLAVPAAVHLHLRPGLAPDILLFAAAAGLYAWRARVDWRRFNAG